MFAEFELLGDLSILQTLCKETDNIFFPFRQQSHSVRIDNSHRRKLGKCFHYLYKFVAACPNLPGVDLLHAPA